MTSRFSTRLSRGLSGNLPDSNDIKASDVIEARQYIANYWKKLTRYNPTDDDNLIGVPKPYLVPAYEVGHSFDFNELYYWDSYFMVQSLMDEEHKDLVLGILDDLVSLYSRFKIIPNATRTYLTGRSQPPFLTSFIFEVYEAYHLDLDWLQQMMAVAEDEYRNVWMGVSKPNVRQVYHGLSRYYDVNYLNDLAETESGWDMTTRFHGHCLNYLPIDLNSLLYKYELDFMKFNNLTKNVKMVKAWAASAKHRRQEVNSLMWSNMRGLFMDYNFVKEKKGSVLSLASFYPLWVGLATEQQAKLLVKALRRFEQRGGLSTTESQSLNKYALGNLPTQWAYPNGWAPLHFIVVKGLERYGYHEDAKRIVKKWLSTNLDWFNKYGVFLEKYNVVAPSKPPAKGLYPSQNGFGWTNAIFERFCKDYLDVAT